MIYRKSQEDIKHMVSKRPYAGLPAELESYHYYISDSGHCIMCVLKCHLKEAKDDMDSYEIPVPVKYVVEKGYRFLDEYVIVEAKYALPFGLNVDDKYTEF
jgi:hypothetical protein